MIMKVTNKPKFKKKVCKEIESVETQMFLDKIIHQ